MGLRSNAYRIGPDIPVPEDCDMWRGAEDTAEVIRILKFVGIRLEPGMSLEHKIAAMREWELGRILGDQPDPNGSQETQ